MSDNDKSKRNLPPSPKYEQRSAQPMRVSPIQSPQRIVTGGQQPLRDVQTGQTTSPKPKKPKED